MASVPAPHCPDTGLPNTECPCSRCVNERAAIKNDLAARKISDSYASDSTVTLFTKNNFWSHHGLNQFLFSSYRKITATPMRRIHGAFRCLTKEGEVTCQDGWLALDSEGYPYPIADSIQSNTYELVKPAVAFTARDESATKNANRLVMPSGATINWSGQQVAVSLSEPELFAIREAMNGLARAAVQATADSQLDGVLLKAETLSRDSILSVVDKIDVARRELVANYFTSAANRKQET